MAKVPTNPLARRRLRWGVLAASCLALLAGAVGLARSGSLPWSKSPAAPAAAIPSPSPAAEPASPSEYTSRVVAYIYESQPITRQELGEYLLARYGAEKLPLLINKRIVDEACRAHGVEVTAAEVEAAVVEDLKGLQVDRDTFVKSFLARYKKNLYEWKEDVVRPRLQLAKLSRGQVTATEEDVRQAFEALYGEKVQGRMILWPLGNERAAVEEASRLRDSESAFAEKAGKQKPRSDLAAVGGKLKPFGRHTMGDDKLEKAVFELPPGQVTTLIKTVQGYVLFKCDKRIPADTTVNLEAVRPRLVKEVLERKTQVGIQNLFQALQKEASPKLLLEKSDQLCEGPGLGLTPLPPPTQVLAYYDRTTPITREDLGEFLIARFGTEKLELLVNRRIIDKECQARGVVVKVDEVEKALDADLKTLKMDRTLFIKDVLSKWNRNLYEWKEDVVRPRLMLTKLCQGQVTCTEEDLRKAFEAYHGEKIEGRMILYPPDQEKFARDEYSRIRDSEVEFDRKARTQASGTLASKGGKLDQPIGRHTLGNDDLEREVFRLQPGEVSILVGTPQGQVIFKCDKRIPAETNVNWEAERPLRTQEILKKKTDYRMQVVFKELRDKANPRLMLQDPNRPEDLAEQARRLLSDGPAAPKPGLAQTPAKAAPVR
jgi:parvulin-like peptidyl-prolyl isomerase